MAAHEQLGVPLSDESRIEVPVQSFGWEALYDNPAQVITPLTAKIPAIREILVNRSGEDSLVPPGNPAGDQELKQIDPKKVRQLATWNIGGAEYWLIHEDYQSGNSATPNEQYLHFVSGNASGLSSLIDLSSRLEAAGTLAKSTNQEGTEGTRKLRLAAVFKEFDSKLQVRRSALAMET